jgi:hypothetical protein
MPWVCDIREAVADFNNLSSPLSLFGDKGIFFLFKGLSVSVCFIVVSWRQIGGEIDAKSEPRGWRWPAPSIQLLKNNDLMILARQLLNTDRRIRYYV